MSSQEEEAEAEAGDRPLFSVFFVLNNHAVLRRETKKNYSVLTSRSIAPTSDRRERRYGMVAGL